MKIYLHIGYHKTGSSFLQMMLSRNRNLLLENRIYYPMAKRDKDAKEGKISPGNGVQLALAISNQSNNEFFQILLGWIEEARKNSCSTLLISSEGLFHSLANNEYSKLFKELKKKTEISEIRGLIFIRDPMDHILSLYKHRGKRGAIENFTDWVENDYETLYLTEKFIVKTKSDEIIWTYRKYKNDSKFMAECLFLNWLEIETPEIPEKDKVNTSLTLSEILVLRELNKVTDKEAVLYLQLEFSKMNVEDKAPDGYLKDYYRKQLDNWFLGNSKIIQSINQVLSAEEKLIIYHANYGTFKDEIISLTSNQVNKMILNRKKKMILLSKLIKRIKSKIE
jgi:hypothetical protein